jgi:hypothetical protein
MESEARDEADAESARPDRAAGGTTFASRHEVLLSILAAALLGLATVGSAWSAYQAARWGGVMTIAFNEGIQLSNDAGKELQEGDAVASRDQAVFLAWVQAVQSDDLETAEYLSETLFSPTMSRAVDAWVKTGEDNDSPFQLDEYRIPQWKLGERLDEQAATRFEDGKNANQTGDNYVLLTVAFSSVMLFAGLAGTVRARSIRIAFVVVGGTLMVGTLGVLATQPVH